MTTPANATPRRREAPDRNLAMELVRVTEAAAMAAGRWVGRGDKNGGDGAAVDAMRQRLSARARASDSASQLSDARPS